MRYFAISIILTAASAACTPNQRIMNSAAPTPAPPPVSRRATGGFEEDLQAMRNADFKFILVFRRRDEAAMDAEDKSFINANTPPDVNRRKLSDDGKAVIIGSNFPFLPGTIANLTDRFVMEDHSKPDAGPIEMDRNANVNANARQRANK